MDRTEGSRVEMGTTDWEQALHLYEEVIACESETSQIRATIKLGRLLKDVPENVLTRAIPILVELLGKPLNSSSSNPSIQEAAAYCLNHLARQDDGDLALVIGQSGAVPFLLRLLRNSECSFQTVLIKFLWRIVSFSNPNRVAVVRNGGLEIVLSLFGSCTDNTRRYLLEILSALTLLREVRRVIISFGGLPFLVESAKNGSMVSRARAAQAIGLLGVTRRVRRILVELGVVPVLTELLREGDTSTKLIAGNALGIIASHVDYLRPVAEAGAIPLYAELLQGPEPIGKEIAEDVFCILAVAEVNAVSIAEPLVRILQGDNDEAKAAAADVLWDLSGYKHSVSVVRSSGAVPILVELLRNSNGDVREKVSGAVAQLSYDEVDRGALADAGVIPLLINLLQDESEELKDNAAEALINFSEDPLLRDRMSEALDIPSFQNIQNRLVRIRASDEHMVRFLRQMSIEQFTWDPELA
ncbi:Armadillo [Macleaya cordata]|uniref:Armadillo n=1 Tax=Macleaya cordata TaxID=56857 RepID=A0A200QJM2_MACCD|nr:Armadillo [Macleaya cordata]